MAQNKKTYFENFYVDSIDLQLAFAPAGIICHASGRNDRQVSKRSGAIIQSNYG